MVVAWLLAPSSTSASHFECVTQLLPTTPRHPHLLCALLASVPFVDLVGSMSNPELPLTVHEYAEHGDPRDPDALAAV